MKKGLKKAEMKKAPQKVEMRQTLGGTLETLPNDLKERIVSRMPFPSILKASNLSKAWLARFSPVSTLEDKDEREFAVRFQKEVWTTFFQVYSDEELCTTYNWACQSWVQLPALSFLPKNIGDQACCGGGADPGLVFQEDFGPNSKERLLVTNIFTQQWKWLPPCPGFDWSFAGGVRVVRNSLIGPYEVIAFSANYDRFNVYNSSTNVWRTTRLPAGLIRPWAYVYLDGVVYMTTRPGVQSLFSLNMEKETSKIITLSYDSPPTPATNRLVVCGGQMLMVISSDLHFMRTILILKVDMELFQLLEVTRGPPDFLQGNHFSGTNPVGHDNFIFFPQRQQPRSSMAMYDLQRNEWSLFEFPKLPKASDRVSRTTNISFHPGLDPFWQL